MNEPYDIVAVGSGFSTAFFFHGYLQHASPSARVLILEQPVPEFPYVRFLESSEFFLKGQDEAQPVTYLALYDPYRNPCFRPFPTDPE